MKILIYNLGIFSTNCYLVYDELSKKACLIDPAIYDDKITNIIFENELYLEYIILTHGHFDHILGAKVFKEKTGAKILIHKSEAEYLENSEKSMASLYEGERILADILLQEDDIIILGSISFKVIHTPGHTKGSCCFVCETEKIIFSGDTLLKNNIGRCDLYGGNYMTLLKSLQKLTTFKKNHIIYPGHENSTTLYDEIATNPHFNTNAILY